MEVMEKKRKDILQKKLEEASRVKLSTTRSDLDSVEEVVSGISGDTLNVRSRQEDSDRIPSFDSTSSSFLEQLRLVLEEIGSSGSTDAWGDSSDPDVEGMIINLLDPEKEFQNPFQMSLDINPIYTGL